MRLMTLQTLQIFNRRQLHRLQGHKAMIMCQRENITDYVPEWWCDFVVLMSCPHSICSVFAMPSRAPWTDPCILVIGSTCYITLLHTATTGSGTLSADQFKTACQVSQQLMTCSHKCHKYVYISYLLFYNHNSNIYTILYTNMMYILTYIYIYAWYHHVL